MDRNRYIIDLESIITTLWAKRKVFLVMWPIVFILSCIWILAQPRWYTCEIKLAPEENEQTFGNLAGIASSLGINLGSAMSSDAIYPTLYPELFTSPEFLVDLLNISVKTDDGEIETDYHTYLRKYQKKNWITEPFIKLKNGVVRSLRKEEHSFVGQFREGERANSFYLSEDDYLLMRDVLPEKIACSIDKKTSVISIKVNDQNKLVCALLADSISVHLQSFIIGYRTSKARQDKDYYLRLSDSARIAYEQALEEYVSYQDSHRSSSMTLYVEEGGRLRNEVNVKLQAYNTFYAQYQAMIAKVQERTPAFAVLKSSTVPQKPAGPKRMIFVIAMCIFATVVASCWICRKILFGGNWLNFSEKDGH